MVAWLRMFAAIGAAALVGACAQLPSDTKLKAFASAVDTTADVLKKSIDVNQELAQRIGEDFYAHRFITRLDSSPERCEKIAKHDNHPAALTGQVKLDDCGYELPPPGVEAISAEELKPRLDLIDAISGYAKALAQASDTGTIDNLEAAAVTLGTVAATAVVPMLGGAAIPVLSPLIKVAARGIGIAAGNAYAVEIREIVLRTDQPLRRAVGQLKHTVKVVKANNETKFNSWQIMKKIVLEDIRSRAPKDFTPVSRSEANREFREVVSDARLMQAKIDALKNYEKVLDALVEAHSKLLEGGEDSDRALAKFIGLSGELTDIAGTLRKKS